MKKLILSVAIAVTALFASAATVEAGCCKKAKKSCCKPAQTCQTTCCKPSRCKPTTVEVCRRNYTKTKCVRGCPKVIRYVEVTYRKTKCNGRSKTWKKTHRA